MSKHADQMNGLLQAKDESDRVVFAVTPCPSLVSMTSLPGSLKGDLCWKRKSVSFWLAATPRILGLDGSSGRVHVWYGRIAILVSRHVLPGSTSHLWVIASRSSGSL